jgi:hypothetical protein
MADVGVPLKQLGFGKTMRRDAWWVTPLVVFLGLGAFVVFATLRVAEGRYYLFDRHGADYLSPFYSPLVFNQPGNPVSHHAWIGEKPSWIPWWITPAVFILPFPALFRFTCYYYRGAYYKAFWADPPSCAVGEPRNAYRGEQKLPLTLQNVHRYFMYIAVLFLFILFYDAWKAMWFSTARDGAPLAGGARQFGIGVGTLVLLLNPILLTGYTLGCHCVRHLVGGCRDSFSDAPVSHKAWCAVTALNKRHMAWAWTSLIWVAFTDLYVRMCAAGVWTDLRIL